jgi:hypothetical protein
MEFLVRNVILMLECLRRLVMYVVSCAECYSYVGVFEKVGDVAKYNNHYILYILMTLPTYSSCAHYMNKVHTR